LKNCTGPLLNNLATEVTPNYLESDDSETINISGCRFVAEREEK
jgi:hypothetical protein